MCRQSLPVRFEANSRLRISGARELCSFYLWHLSYRAVLILCGSPASPAGVRVSGNDLVHVKRTCAHHVVVILVRKSRPGSAPGAGLAREVGLARCFRPSLAGSLRSDRAGSLLLDCHLSNGFFPHTLSRRRRGNRTATLCMSACVHMCMYACTHACLNQCVCVRVHPCGYMDNSFIH